MLQGKTIILGVSSSIAAYKACDLVSRLKKLGADVWVVMTDAATKLVSPLTFRTLSGNPVLTNLFADELASLPVPHIALAKRAAAIIIAPATANIIGKIANGIADDPLTTIVMAATVPKLIAPAMNCEMWRNPVVLENVRKLRAENCEFVGPVEGKLACGDDDIGCMSESEEIISKLLSFLVPKQDLVGKHVLVTAGGTREAIDPVRYISNRSSGKMGYAVARAARERGATVTLISAPTNLPAPLDIKPVKVESASEMLTAMLKHYSKADVVIMAAAVSDYKPVVAELALPTKRKKGKVNFAATKIKKSNHDLQLMLKPTPDILKALARQKGRKDKVLVGFALETNDLIKNAKKKLKEKDLDLIVANKPKTFDGDQIEFSVIDRKGKTKNYTKQAKAQAAQKILDQVISLI